MKKIVVGAFMLFITNNSIGQCTVDPFIQSNYQADAIAFVLREIQSNPSDPNVNDPFVPAARAQVFLEKLSAIYENPNNEPIIDNIFNSFQIHANFEIAQALYYSKIYLQVDFSAPWLNDFITTGISGNNTLDNLMTGYEMSITSEFPLSNYHLVEIDTNTFGLNIPAIVDDFEQVSGVLLAEAVPAGVIERLNYTGVPYSVNGENVEACDITFDEDLVCFSLYSGFCPTGCTYSESWCVTVNELCEVGPLELDDFDQSTVALYPNPVENTFYVDAGQKVIESINIYTINGLHVETILDFDDGINISNYAAGMYFLKIESANGQSQTKKIIKQ